MNIVPVILSGGSGSRLWPKSRRSFPKQFTQLVGEKSLFAATVSRFVGPGFESPIVVTSADFRFVVLEQLKSEGITASDVLIEPCARSTGPAVLAAALHLCSTNPDALMLVVPSDHLIADDAAFRDVVRLASREALAGRIVTFGIEPTRAETGYGWLECRDDVSVEVVPLLRFVEKPNLHDAQEMMTAGRFLWNSGVFLFTASTVVDAFQAYAPDVSDAVRSALLGARTDFEFLSLDPVAWERTPDISVDYAVMERATNLSVVKFSGAWTDLGSWESVSLEMGADAFGNSIAGNVTQFDCQNSLLRSDSADLALVGIGLSNLMVVAMDDAVLVADRSRSQEVKTAVALLKARGAKQAEQFSVDHRPWGWFETLALADRFQVKRIHVNPGAALSLQSHYHRAEHWIVVHGTAEVEIDGRIQVVSENQSVFVPLGSKHRLKNHGKVPMVLIEVQTGSYLGEDDIIRHEDVYMRGQGAKG